MSYKPLPVPATDFNVCIIGAGFSGIGMAVKLKEIGVKYKIIEKGCRFGGTWCDKPVSRVWNRRGESSVQVNSRGHTTGLFRKLTLDC